MKIYLSIDHEISAARSQLGCPALLPGALNVLLPIIALLDLLLTLGPRTPVSLA